MGMMGAVKADAAGDGVDNEGHALDVLIDEIQANRMRVFTSFSLCTVLELVVAMLAENK